MEMTMQEFNLQMKEFIVTNSDPEMLEACLSTLRSVKLPYLFRASTVAALSISMATDSALSDFILSLTIKLNHAFLYNKIMYDLCETVGEAYIQDTDSEYMVNAPSLVFLDMADSADVVDKLIESNPWLLTIFLLKTYIEI